MTTGQRLSQAKASLDQAKVNLEHAIITSPISGTIISRSIDRGQTVAASFSSPTLFTIGEDLTKMQVSTNIDEADVGKIKTGMEATFTVDAYPQDTFRRKISQVRLASNLVQNVVTYNAMAVSANNGGPLIKVLDLHKYYEMGDTSVHALRGVCLEIRRAEFVAIMGASGSGKQRVAIARSLVNRPSILLADEPTGNLDSRTSVEIMQVLQELNDRDGLTVILVTHEPDIADYSKRVITFRDGQIIRDQPVLRRRMASEILASMPPSED